MLFCHLFRHAKNKRIVHLYELGMELSTTDQQYMWAPLHASGTQNQIVCRCYAHVSVALNYPVLRAV